MKLGVMAATMTMSSPGLQPHVTPCNKHPDVQEVNEYCVDCQIVVCPECNQNKPDHSVHCVKGVSEAVSQKILEIENMLMLVQNRLYSLQSRQEEVEVFESAYVESKQVVRDMAQDLVIKIREHEERLIEEIDMRRETQYKRLSWTKESLLNQVNNLENVCEEADTAVSRASGDPVGFLSGHRPIADKLRETVLEDAPIYSDTNDRLSPIYIMPVRCNTAFGTLETVDDVTNHNGNTPKKRFSVCSMTSQQSSPLKPVRTGSLTAMSPAGKQLNQYSNSLNPVHSGLGGRRLSSNSLLPIQNQTGFGGRRLSLQVSPYINDFSPSLKQKCFGSNLHKNLGSHFVIPSMLVEDMETGSCVKLKWEVMTEGSNPGEINCPNDVTFLDDGRLVVSDRDNQRLQIFSGADGKPLKVIGQGKLKPRRVATTTDGNIAVTDSKENCVKVYTSAGVNLSTWGKKRFKSSFKEPCGVAVNKQKQFIVSDMEKRIVTFHNSDGKSLKQCVSQGGGEIEFNSPSYLAVGSNGDVFVSDNCSHSVKVFNSDGRFKFQFNQLEDDKCFKYPNGICVDNKGFIYVADWGSHCISQFEEDGTFVRHVLTREDGLCHPAGIAVHDGNLAVSEYSDNHSCVRVFSIE